MHRLFNPFGVKVFAGDGEMHVNRGEHLGIGVGTGGVDVGDLLTALAQDVTALEGRGRCQLPD